MNQARDRLTPLADTHRIDLFRLFHAKGADADLGRSSRPRIAVVTMAMAAAVIVLIARAADLATFNGDPVAISSSQSAVAPTRRARIVDRNGEILAANIETWDVYVRRVDIDHVPRLVDRLRDLDSVASPAALAQRLSGKSGRAKIAGSVTPRQRQAIFDLAEPGVEFESQLVRVYPNAHLAGHVLGWVNADGFGASGVERAFDGELREQNKPLILSLDSRVQFTLEDELQAAIAAHKPVAAIGIVTHIPTGEVLAMASWPNFDPNQFNITTPGHRRNRALTDPYELGSVFKPLTLAMALETGWQMDKVKIDVGRKLVIAGREIQDFHPGPSPMTATDILVHSSNKGAARMAMTIGGSSQKNFLDRFGLLDPAPIELRGSAGAYMATADWSLIKTATIGYGHGISVTALSFVAALGGVVNHGKKVPLTIFPVVDKSPPSTQVVSAETSRHVRAVMRKVVTDGSGGRADVPGFGVAGKTGSAEKWDPKISAYAKDRNVSSFVGIFPWESPQYMVFVLLDEPQGDRLTHGFETAGWNAAPAVGRIISRIGPLLDAPFSRPDKQPDTELSAQMGAD